MKSMIFKAQNPMFNQQTRILKFSKSIICKRCLTVLLPILILVFVSSSCVTQRKMEYLRPVGTSTSTFNVAQPAENKVIVPGDELYIQVYSFTNNIASSVGSEGTSTNITPYSAAIISYKVSHDSSIMFPLVGTVKIAGNTITGAELKLQTLLTSYLNNPSVNIKLVNTNISVIGEVSHPGNYAYTNAPLNIFQALSLAGDITEFGDRANVRIIRQKDKKVEVYTLNLTGSDIITSKYFFLEANDVVYIRPMKSRIWGISKFPYELLFSAVSSIILVLTYQRTVGK